MKEIFLKGIAQGILAGVMLGFVLSGVGLAAEDNQFTRFVFSGHLRGPDNFKINPLLPYFADEIRHLKKDFVLLTGDMICGYRTAYHKESLNKEWELFDRCLAKVDAPIHRVPSNHDWHSRATQEVFNERYGPEFFSFQKNDVLVIGLNTARLMPDSSIDWAAIWDHAPLPNAEGIMPEGGQWSFLLDQLNQAAHDASVHQVVLFMSSPLWKLEGTRRRWWEEVHPLLAKSGKTHLVLAGDDGLLSSNEPLERDRVLYVVSGLGILEDDQRFSMAKGVYLQIIFETAKEMPDIYVHVIQLSPQNYRQFLASIPKDTDKFLYQLTKMARGERIHVVNRVRIKVKRWLMQHLDFFDPRNNLAVILLVLAGGGLLGYLIFTRWC